MIRGLDGDETVFLDLVAKQQEEIANQRFNEESQEIKEYRVRQVIHLLLMLIIFVFDWQKQSNSQSIGQSVSWGGCRILEKVQDMDQCSSDMGFLTFCGHIHGLVIMSHLA